MDINSIIEMINNTVRPIEKVHSPYRVGYDDACDDMIEQLRKISDKEPELRRCLQNLIDVTKHLNICPGVLDECENVLK